MDYYAQSFEELRNQTCKGRVDLFIFNNILMTLLVCIQNHPLVVIRIFHQPQAKADAPFPFYLISICETFSLDNRSRQGV